MAIKKKKKKKKRAFAARSTSGSREQSPLRPKFIEKMPPCRDTCPSGNRIREFVTVIAQAERAKKPIEQALEEAWHIYTDTSPFPAVCGRVCPHPCEDGCNRKELDGAVNINKTERAIGDFGLDKGLKLKTLETDGPRSEKVAVVGAGPGGLSCAYQLARRGVGVTVFEAADKPGGMLLWGIPRYRLPAEVIDGEIQKILDLGVELKCNTRVGTDVTLDDLKSQYQAVFVGIGAHTGLKLRVEGEDAENVLSGVVFLNRFNRGEKIEVGDNVIVVGGGNTAIDAARVCRRLGATTTILYRRTRKEMPANEEEIEEALEEGVKLEYLAAPIGFNKDGDRITTMKCIRMELGEPDASGRRRPVPIEGSEFDIPASYVIPAISQAPDFTGFESLIEGRDWVKVDEGGASLKAEGVYAGGDVVNLDLVTTAVGHGRLAAETIDQKFREGEKGFVETMPLIKHDKMRLDHYEKKDRAKPPALPVEERLASMDAEVNQSFSLEQTIEETRRCMSCGYCFDCEKCWLFCQDQAVEKPMTKFTLYTFKLENCTGCKKCAEECPCGYIDML
ncbi:MAG: NAD(P)-binding protein [Planctomycetota bacterium]|jgi:NADPH-dependent glutamate synthase beta subunit-like oxidoreductase/Pyruvate/2-oxoacid:ferredoxin oxidoreductase delta subunit